MNRSLATSLFASLLIATAGTAHAGNWDFTLMPYAWGTDVGLDASFNGRQVVDETIPVSDLMEIMSATAMLRGEAQNGAHGAMFDLFYVALEDEVNDVALPRNAGTGDFVSEIKLTIFDLTGFYDPNGNKQGFAFLYGTRVIDERFTVDATYETGSGTVEETYEAQDTMVDALVGVRYTKYFSRHLSIQTQADISVGGTEYTWSAGPLLTYSFGESARWAVSGGYRHMTIAFDDDVDGADTEMTISGPLVGLKVSF